MRRLAAAFIALAVTLTLAPTANAATAPKQSPAKHHVTRSHEGYGFLPGVRPPRVIARDRQVRYWRKGPHFYGPAWPRYYRGRWNGGGFGPCYANTPIGYVWTCGR